MELGEYGMNTYLLRLVACLSLCVSLNTFGALSIRDLDGDLTNGHEGVYDDVLDITWLAESDLLILNPNGFDGNPYAWYGSLQPQDAPSLIEQLNSISYLGVSSWRLPIATLPEPSSCYEYWTDSAVLTCDGNTVGYYSEINFSNGEFKNELLSLYYETIGAQQGQGISNANSTNKQLFYNFDNDGPVVRLYDSQGEDEGFAQISMSSGTMSWPANGGQHFWPVFDSDPYLNPVPLPAGIYLFLSGLVGLGLMRGRKSNFL